MTCGWFITAPENRTVKLQLTSRFSSSYKSSDRVEVYDVDGSELSVNSLRLSNPHANTDTIYSKFRSLYILFKSDSHPQESLSDGGIIVLYTAFETGESDYLTTQERFITKPFFLHMGGFKMHGVILCLVVFVPFLLTPSSCTKLENQLYLHYMVNVANATTTYLRFAIGLLLYVFIYIILNAIRFGGRHSETTGGERIQLCQGN